LPKGKALPKKIGVIEDPSSPTIEPPVVNVVLRTMVEDLRHRLFGDPWLEERYLSGDEAVEAQSLLLACAVVGVAPGDYLALLEVDGMLYQLHHWAVTEAICGINDPGPYDSL
jgi:hypothetical protein